MLGKYMQTGIEQLSLTPKATKYQDIEGFPPTTRARYGYLL
jgi:hypothetical protein